MVCQFEKKDDTSHMSQIGETTLVRIDKKVYDKLKIWCRRSGFTAVEVVTFCVEDCLKAVEAKKPIIPRIALLQQVIEGGPRFNE
jgi:hypothetical protein